MSLYNAQAPRRARADAEIPTARRTKELDMRAQFRLSPVLERGCGQLRLGFNSPKVLSNLGTPMQIVFFLFF